MHAVIVDGDVSYPATSGKRLRTLHLMLQMAKRHRLTYIGRLPPDRPDVAQSEAFFRAHGIEPLLVDDPIPRKAGALFLARLAANLLSPVPYSVQSHRSRRMWEVVTHYAEHHDVDLWQFEWSPYLELLADRFPGPRLLVAHNVDTLIWKRYYDHARGPLRRLFLRSQWQKFHRFEARALRTASRVVAVSHEDAALIRDEFGQPNVDVVDNGIDRAFFEEIQPQRDPRRILFLGALDWRPNLDAVNILVERIFPEVLRHEPQARLALVGRAPPPRLVQRVKALPNVELHANVPDVRPFLASSGVMTVPLRIGGGSRLKILESLAGGLPVISTAVGAEGLQLTSGEHYLAAHEDEMAAALVQAIRRPEPFLAMARRGRALVLRTYDWAVLARKLEDVWEKCLHAPSPRASAASPGG